MPDIERICNRYARTAAEERLRWEKPVTKHKLYWEFLVPLKNIRWELPNLCREVRKPSIVSSVEEGGEKKIIELLSEVINKVIPEWKEDFRLNVLNKELSALKERCTYIERHSSILVPIESFAPEPYKILKPFHVVVRFQDEQYIASFFDANINTSGDTQEEAVSNIKDIIIGTYELLDSLNEEELGPEPKKRITILREFISEK